jgi:signal transduction histidine kinase
MCYSSVSFDTAHTVADILKDSAYFVNIIGLALSSINYNLRLKQSNDSLEEINASLMEKQELIRTQYERLKESDRMKNEFKVSSHELRTPIQPILSLSEMLRPKIQDVRERARAQNDFYVLQKLYQSLRLKKERFVFERRNNKCDG